MNCSANTQLETTIVIGMYNTQQEKQLYGELVGTTPFFWQLKALRFFKASKKHPNKYV